MAVTDPRTLIVDVEFARVKVFANKLTVVKAFEVYTFPDTYSEVSPDDPTTD